MSSDRKICKLSYFQNEEQNDPWILQTIVLSALPFAFQHNRCLTQPTDDTHTAACPFSLMSCAGMGSFLIPFHPSLTTVELSDWLGNWQLKHLVLMYKTNINKKSCTDVALTNPQQQEKKQQQQMKGEKNQYWKGKEKRNRILQRLFFTSLISGSNAWPKGSVFSDARDAWKWMRNPLQGPNYDSAFAFPSPSGSQGRCLSRTVYS